MKYGYARISTIDQNPDMQLNALHRAGCAKIFKDERSGATTKRPALSRCLKTLDAGDTLIVWKLDRLARSLCDLIAMTEDFQKRRIQFRSLTEEINTAPANIPDDRSIIAPCARGVALVCQSDVSFSRNSSSLAQRDRQIIRVRPLPPHIAAL